jgi:DNA processing protein
MALTRLAGLSQAMALELYRRVGSAQTLYEQRAELRDIFPDATSRLTDSLQRWDDALKRSAAEMAFADRHNIQVLTLEDPDYPDRLRHCADAPLVLYYRGSTVLNRRRVVNIVGTRQATPYGRDLIHRFVTRLHVLCPDVLVVSGLAYGVDICAHRESLAVGYDTVAVLAHGLDTIYPSRHRQTAAEMVSRGGLLTEYMSQTEPLPNNFRQRNRIVAGISDATILVESAARGGGLITCRIAQEYGRDVFAFPGAVGAPYSEGCHLMIRKNTAALITSADDFVEAMGWTADGGQRQVVERQLFPDLTSEEQAVVSQLKQENDQQLNQLSVRTNISVSQLVALLFQLEMKGVVRPMAGGTYHLLS